MNLAHLFPVASSSFEPGSCEDAVARGESDWSEETRVLAQAELCCLRGNYEGMRSLLSGLVGSDEVSKLPSVCYLYAYSCLATGNMREARRAYVCLQRSFQRYMDSWHPRKGGMGVAHAFVVDMAQVATHFELMGEKTIQAEDYACYLTTPLQMLAGYNVAYRAYMERRFEYSLGIAHVCTSLSSSPYPIPEAYLHVVQAMDLISLRQVGEAEERFERAMELTLPDGLHSILAVHHKSLEGLIEVCVRDRYPSEYQRIIEIARSFDAGRSSLMSHIGDSPLALNRLTAMEYSVAMLAVRGWKNEEIANYLSISFHTVKHHLSVVYRKLGVSGRSGLRGHLIK